MTPVNHHMGVLHMHLARRYIPGKEWSAFPFLIYQCGPDLKRLSLATFLHKPILLLSK